ncbi:MAG: DUF2934 domain-containing protein [Verrucomicrobiales bacterium]|nr:DUF2934 domain-containing protein [Verrucomicrobiales bacterium]
MDSQISSNRVGSVEAQPSQPDRAQIATLAYALYVQGGCREDHAVEDWLEAELRLRQANDGREPFTAPPPSGPESIHERGNTQVEARTKREQDSPFARDQRGSASREEIRQQQTPMRPASRQSQRSSERSKPSE